MVRTRTVRERVYYFRREVGREKGPERLFNLRVRGDIRRRQLVVTNDGMNKRRGCT